MTQPADTVPPRLAALAEAHGVALRYESFWHEDVEVPPAVLRQALAAMGVDADRADPPAAQPGLPPIHVITHGTDAVIRWPARSSRTVAWTIAADERPDEIVHRGIVVRDEGHYTLRTPALATGYWRLAIDGDELGSCLLVVAPERCWTPAALQEGERWWGCTVQVYALRSGRNWGIGDFGDLRRLVEAAARHGASFIGLSPLHALFPHAPAAASPYSPSSRTALNPIYLDVQTLVELSGCKAAQDLVNSEAFQSRVRKLRESELVDYPNVAAAKEEVLQLLWHHFEQQELGAGGSRGEHFRAYVAQRRDTLWRHALFEALQERLHAADAGVWGWPAWPPEYREPRSPQVQAFEREHQSAVQFRCWLQWLAELQLESAQRYARTLGMGLGLYCDLAVGANEGGAETWQQSHLYALGMHAGAPPDPLNTLGQDWGLPPVNPEALEAARCRPFIEILRANMRHAGALRLDHVMSLMRLFWTGGQGGTYVRYPLDTLLGILALESHRHRCLVIGEDLGNVAPQMREAMQARALVSYRPLLFERNAEGGFRAPAQWHAQAMAVVSTHDLPTLRGFWLGEDIELAAGLELYPDNATRETQVLNRSQDRARLLLALQHESLLPPGITPHPTSLPDATPAFVDAVYAYLARTPCWLLGVQLEDVTGQLLQVNVPGTTEDRYPNWRRKLSLGVDEIATDARFASVAAVLRAERSGPAPAEDKLDDLPALATAEVPGATYRIQFHRACTFEQVTGAVPYLQALGITHLYSSPYLRARPGSTHGYDIVDHTALNPEVGDAAAHERLCEALRRHGMHQMLDIVPNHMGVLEADNAWWLDVLEHGRASDHADTFDIEWQPAAREMAGRILLPVLGGQYGEVLEAGEIQLQFDAAAGAFALHYWDHRFPIDPALYRDIFAALPPPTARDEQETDSHAVVASLLDAFAKLPPRDTDDEAARRARVRDAALHKKSLARLAQQHPWLAGWIRDCVRHFNGQPGEPASFDPLAGLIARQAYRLAEWRAASDDVNYRRFFDVSTLAGLRMEHPEVFEATHRLVLRWLQSGVLAGLRIDHPDGLSDPQQYFERLQSQYARGAIVGGREPRALYLVVEKILAEHESLPDSWPVHGDTGYRFGALVNGLLVDGAREQAVDALERSFTGRRDGFDAIAYESRKLIIATLLFSELNWLTHALHRITRANRRTGDFTRNRLRLALTELAAAFPVYRTYLRVGEPASATDRQHIDWGVAAAKRRLGDAQAPVLRVVRDVLLGEGEAAGADPARRGRFIARWQQFTAPVMAKGLEDTAFYRYLRLASLNEVGSDPRRFGVSPAAFHAANQTRARFKPHALLATSTHDSKRGEDLRARIAVLAEDPVLWQDSVQRVAGLAERYLTDTEDGPAPSRNDIWLLYQTLVGLWPVTVPSDEDREQLRQRIQAYMLKAVREAKVYTNWTSPEPAYEDALASYIDALLRPGQPNPFVAELERVAARIAPFGFRNSLAQVALKLTVPGVPDIYQGCERWNFSLVDPDNRRPVDFDALAADLEAVRALYATGSPARTDWRRLADEVAGGRIKLVATWRLLQLRRAWPELLRDGVYLPLACAGHASEHVVAFARQHQQQTVLVVAARLTYTLCQGDPGRWGAWGWADTVVQLADQQPALAHAGRWRDWLTGRVIDAGTANASGLALSELLGDASALPFAVLVPADGGPAA
jgi:(1->4)-alpha-D-glucan 1-alpha-D-glucosylmutase